MKVYIAGPMSGLPDLNYPAFFLAEQELRQVGYEVLNPARAQGRENCRTWLDFMRASLIDLSQADGIAMLPGWHNSRGAAFEYRVGHDLGIPVQSLLDWLEEDTPEEVK